MRRDAELRRIDVVAALTAGMPNPGRARTALFGDAVVAAALHAEDLDTGADPLRFLAGCVRSLGLDVVSALPQPLLGAERNRLVRAWMSAARVPPGVDVARDELFGRWLEAVAMVLTVRERAAGTAPAPPPPDPAGDTLRGE